MLGVKLADELSKQLGNSQKQIQVFDRNLLKTYTAINHVDADSLKTDQEVTTFAHNLGASAVVTARAERIQGDSFRLSVRFLKAKDKSLVVRTDWIVDRTLPVVSKRLTLGNVVPQRFMTNRFLPGSNSKLIHLC